jgi:uncharacterized protein (DUF1499 family)
MLVTYFSLIGWNRDSLYIEKEGYEVADSAFLGYSSSFDRRDQGAHKFIASRYFEWWFFMGILENDYTFVATFQITESLCWVRLTFYLPDGEITNFYQKFNLKEIIASENRCYIKMGRNYIYEKNGNYYIRFVGDNIKMYVKLENNVNGWIVRKDREEDGLWLVPIPRGKLSGKLWLNKKWNYIKGTGYYEHFWHRGRFIERDMGLKQIYFEVGYTKNISFIFIEAINLENKKNIFGIVKINNSNIPIKNLKFEYMNYTISKKNGKKYPQIIKINLEDKGMIVLKIKKILEEASTYFRILNKTKVYLCIDDLEYKEKGLCYSEVIYLE